MVLISVTSIRDSTSKIIDNTSTTHGIIYENYTPYEYVTIDEMLPSFRGRCPFRQYLPNKPSKYGIKIFALADSKTFYVSKMEVYLGKQPPGAFEVSYSAQEVVQRLVAPISGTWRNVTIDNWFTSFPLAIELLNHHKLTIVGTVKKNKREIPPNFVQTRNRENYTSIFGFRDEITIVSYVPKKGKNVVLFSTMHHDAAIDVDSGEKAKPEIITLYNRTKGGVDTVDQLCASYNTSRNSRRWPLTIFFTLLNVAGINSRVIYTLNNLNNVKRKLFLKKLALDLISDGLQQRESNVHLKKELRGTIKRLTNCKQINNPPKQPRTDTPQRCSECPRKKDRKTKYSCQSCSVFLCLEHVVPLCNACVSQVEESD